jgi:hypothetical protein
MGSGHGTNESKVAANTAGVAEMERLCRMRLGRMGLGIGLMVALIMLFALPFTGARASPILQVPPTPAVTCDPSYPTLCIPPEAPDLDCGDITDRYFPVLPPDPHDFDRGGQPGIGCEPSA